ncbi:MAG: 6-phosphogluconolactonase [Candidatus Taylorbacteria bacterium]
MNIHIHKEVIPVGTKLMADKIFQYLSNGEKVLWLVCGGSNIPISVEVLNLVKRRLQEKPSINLKNLTVSLTDERYGSINHPDSNWRQLTDNDFDFDAVTSIPVLYGKSFDETTKLYGMNMRDAWSNNSVHIGQFGIGIDGHIAGVLPRTTGVSSPGTIASYDAGKFRRLTITLATIEKLDVAYVFAYGQSKKPALENLQTDLIDEIEPAQVLKRVKDVELFTD